MNETSCHFHNMNIGKYHLTSKGRACLMASGKRGNKILLKAIKGPANIDVSKKLVQAVPRGSLEEKYRAKPRINPPSIKPNKAPAKRLNIFKTEKSKALLMARKIKNIIA